MNKILLVSMFFFIMQSCSSDEKIVSNFKPSNDVGLYNSGLDLLKTKKFNEAIEKFSELEIQYPYSDWSSRGQMLIGFAHYTNREYDDAILTLSKFIELNPDHESIPYALYLKAYSYYERMPAVSFDQRTSEKAIEEFNANIFNK